ncbi:MAG: hypothetical protein ABIK15_10110 [Pseudomonadota bacterium]
MKRKNFYLLLDLPVDPPEDDPDKIEAAIQKKQAEWSKQCNHPTRGIQAKQLIDFIPEIRKVMSDPELRKKEAKNADAILAKRTGDKFKAIDRHLSIYNSKGMVTSQEIQKLVKIHSVETDEILKWMLKKEKSASTPAKTKTEKITELTQEQKLEAIFKSLAIRMRKGFILEKEILHLSRTYHIDRGEIVKTIPFPVQEKNDPPATGVPAPIDQAIFKTINGNLKIVGKETLYEFLELPALSDLETLCNRAAKIQQKLQGVGKKDAAVTAGSILAGHCKTIFTSPETRISYDIAQAQSFLALLDSDMNIAELNGVIRSEYTEAIMNNAAELGMSREEASDYIEEYCSRKNWKVRSKQKKKRFLAIASLVIASVLFVAGISIYLITSLQDKRLSNEYRQVLTSIEMQKKLEDKKETLLSYIGSHGKNRFTNEAEKKLALIDSMIRKRNALDEKNYQSTVTETSALLADLQFEKAEAVYNSYLKNHPDGRHVPEIQKKRSGLPDFIDSRDFQAIHRIPETDLKERLNTAIQYLKNHPQGQYHQQVTKMVADLEEPYFIFIRQEITKQEKRKDWKACIELCDRYIAYFPKGKHQNQLKGEQYFFSKQLEKTTLLQELARKVEREQTDPTAVIRIYSEYLKSHPDSPIQYEVRKLLESVQKKP